MKRLLPILLSFVLLLTGTINGPVFSSASTITKNVTEDYYLLLVGVQPSSKPGSGGSYEYNSIGEFNKSDTVPEIAGATSYKVETVEPYNGSNFPFDDHCFSAGGWSKYTFDGLYEDYTASSMSVYSNYKMSGRTVSYSFNAMLNSETDIEVYSMARRSGRSDVESLLYGSSGVLGDKANFENNFRTIYNSIESAIENCDSTNELHLIFTPIVIHYSVIIPKTIEVGSLYADLTIPASAKQGESFTLKDNTSVDADTVYDYGVLERSIGGKPYETIATWTNESGKPGVNSGKNYTDSINEITSVTYKLTCYPTAGEPSVCIKSIAITDATEMNGKASLGLPDVTYEGHPVLATDNSTIKINGENYSVARAYKENLASNSYTIKSGSGSIKKNKNTGDADITFTKPGSASVNLTVTIKNGVELQDTKSITVLKTPAIAAKLGGNQKANRKQIITASIAQNPSYPVSEVYIEIQKKNGGEKVHLNYAKNGNNTCSNSNIIKTRAIADNESTDYFTNIKLEFLTKNTTSEAFTYTVYAKDTRGNTDTATGDFTVIPDEAPVAVISTEEYFLREEGKNIAHITASDISQTGGDNVSRVWQATSDSGVTASGSYYASSSFSGFKKTAFGSDQSIQFDKTGVGEVKIKLTVTDSFKGEETLDEYITQSDFLSSSAEITTKVLDVAPTVSIEPLNTKSARVIYYGETKAQREEIKSQLEALAKDELSNGIILDVKDAGEPFEKSGTARTDYCEGFDVLYSGSTPAYYTGGMSYGPCGYWDTSWYTADNNNAYILNANYVYTDTTNWWYSYTFPFTITAYQYGSGNALWTTTVTQEMWGSSRITEGGPVQYNETDYLALRTGDSTLLFLKSNGSFVTKIPMVTGNYLYQNDKNLYTYIEGAGLYAVNIQSGAIRCIVSGNLLAHPRLLDGKLTYIRGSSAEQPVFCQFDLASEDLFSKALMPIPESGVLSCIGIGGDGRVIVKKGNKTYLFNKDLDYVNSVVTDYTYVFAVENPTSEYEYLVMCKYDSEYYSKKSTEYYYAYMAAVNLFTGETLETSRTGTETSDYRIHYGTDGYAPDYMYHYASWDNGDGFISSHTGCEDSSIAYASYTGFSGQRYLEGTVTFDFRNKTAECYGNGVSYFPFSSACGSNITIAGYMHDNYLIAGGALTSRQNPNSYEGAPFNKYVRVTKIPHSEEEIIKANLVSAVPSLGRITEDELYVMPFTENPLTSDVCLNIADKGALIIPAILDKISDAGSELKAKVLLAVETLKDYLESDEQTIKAICVTKDNGAAKSSLSYSLTLNPSKDYYYEYSMIEDGVISSQTETLTAKEKVDNYKENNGIETMLNDSGFKVLSSVETDFRGDLPSEIRLNSNPGRISDGKWLVASYSYSKPSQSNIYSGGGSFDITVPEGKQAIVYAEYLSNATGISFSVDGRQWGKGYTFGYTVNRGTSVESYNSGADTNFTSDVLPSGIHTIGVKGYGPMSSGSTTMVYLTAVKIYYVEPCNVCIGIKDDGDWNGANNSYTVTEAGVYRITLSGPSSSTKVRGGLVEGYADLKEGDIISYYLGPGTSVSETRGAKGTDGSGYGDDGKYKATVSINGELAMVAGGAGSDGAQGTGNGAYQYSRSENTPVAAGTMTCPTHGTQYIRQTDIATVGGYVKGYKCMRCGQIAQQVGGGGTCSSCGKVFAAGESGLHNHTYYDGIGGAGGIGGVGGYAYVSAGGSGAQGSAAGWSGTMYRSAGGTGGDGGCGGKSWTSPSLIYDSAITGGQGTGASKISIAKLTGKGNSVSFDGTLDVKATKINASGNVKEASGRIRTLPTVLDFATQRVPTIKGYGGSIAKEPSCTITASSSTNTTYLIDPDGAVMRNGRFYMSLSASGVMPSSSYSCAEASGSLQSSADLGFSPAHSISINTNHSSTSKSSKSASLGRYEAFYFPSDYHARVEEGRYASDMIAGEIFVENAHCDGETEITLSSQASKWYLTSFSLYYLEGNKKIYVIDDSLINTYAFSKWEVADGSKLLVDYSTEKPVEENAPLIYRKGEYVDHKVYYSDYENDPSLKGGWIYAQIPYNDGRHENAGIELDEMGEVVKIGNTAVSAGTVSLEEAAGRLVGTSYDLSSPIHKFYVDGKYIAMHYEYDDTSRGAKLAAYNEYNQRSNFAELPFYIMGTANAPYIESISTNPATPKEDEMLSLNIQVNDIEKDELSLVTEVYCDRNLVFKEKKANITAVNGVYPVVKTQNFLGEAGTYEVMCTVRDETGAGLGEYRFVIVSQGRIEGMVRHTELWEERRKAYNLLKFSREGNEESQFDSYSLEANPRLRGTNVFWAGEEFCLEAAVKGSPDRVTASIKGSELEATLTYSGQKDAGGDKVYTGRLWESGFRKRWGNQEPELLVFDFAAQYQGGSVKTATAAAIVDNTRAYELMHRIK